MENKVAINVVIELVKLLGRVLETRSPEDAKKALENLLSEGVRVVTADELDTLEREVLK